MSEFKNPSYFRFSRVYYLPMHRACLHAELIQNMESEIQAICIPDVSVALDIRVFRISRLSIDRRCQHGVFLQKGKIHSPVKHSNRTWPIILLQPERNKILAK